MSINNIFKVIDETSLEEILSDHKNELVVVTFTSTTINNNDIRKCLLQLSTENKDCIFVFITTDDFINTTYKYTKNVKPLPKSCFYFDMEELVSVQGSNISDVVVLFYNIKNKIIQKLQKMVLMTKNKTEQANQTVTDSNFNPTTNNPNPNPNPNSNIQQQNNNRQLDQYNRLEHIQKMIQLKKIHEIDQLQKIARSKELEELKIMKEQKQKK